MSIPKIYKKLVGDLEESVAKDYLRISYIDERFLCDIEIEDDKYTMVRYYRGRVFTDVSEAIRVGFDRCFYKNDGPYNIEIYITHLRPDKIQNRGDRRDDETSMLKILDSGFNLTPPEIIREDGKIMLLNGNHRRRAYLKAKKLIPSVVVDIVRSDKFSPKYIGYVISDTGSFTKIIPSIHSFSLSYQVNLSDIMRIIESETGYDIKEIIFDLLSLVVVGELDYSEAIKICTNLKVVNFERYSRDYLVVSRSMETITQNDIPSYLYDTFNGKIDNGLYLENGNVITPQYVINPHLHYPFEEYDYGDSWFNILLRISAESENLIADNILMYRETYNTTLTLKSYNVILPLILTKSYSQYENEGIYIYRDRLIYNSSLFYGNHNDETLIVMLRPLMNEIIEFIRIYNLIPPSQLLAFIRTKEDQHLKFTIHYFSEISTQKPMNLDDVEKVKIKLINRAINIIRRHESEITNEPLSFIMEDDTYFYNLIST